MKVAALDLGSNTFLCLIAEVEVVNGQPCVEKIYSDDLEVVRLGQDLEKNKFFHHEALVRAESCFKKFSEKIKEHRPEKILAMATSAARDATNQRELFLLAEKYNIPLEIIPGETEAQITYQGAVSGFQKVIPPANLMVIDIGGGSTEFIFGKNHDLICGESYNIGCVRLTEKFISAQPTSDVEIKNVFEFVSDSIAKAKKLCPENFQLTQIIAVAGTPTAIVAAELGFFDAHKIDGYILTKTNLEEWLQKLKNSNLDEKIKMGFSEGRADVILIGVIILLQTLKIFNLNQMTVSTRGVRYGVALEVGRRNLLP